MKLNFKYMIVVGLLIGMTGCDDNLETFAEHHAVQVHIFPLFVK